MSNRFNLMGFALELSKWDSVGNFHSNMRSQQEEETFHGPLTLPQIRDDSELHDDMYGILELALISNRWLRIGPAEWINVSVIHLDSAKEVARLFRNLPCARLLMWGKDGHLEVWMV